MSFYKKTWFKVLAAVFLIWLIHGMYVASQNPAPKQETKQEVKTEQKAPEKKALKFDKAIAEATAELKNKEFHKYTQDVHISVDEKNKEVTMTAVMNDGLKKWVAMEYADTMIRRFSSWAAMFNDGLTKPTNDNYGSLFDEYKIHIGVAPKSQINKQENWYYEKVIYPRMHTKQGPNWKEAQRKGE